ncbi:MAG: hypothetical protein AB7I32_01065 [Gammaproteobacteria bacterium]
MRLLRELDDHLQAGAPVPPALVEALHVARMKAEKGCALDVVLGVDRGRRDAALRRAGELLCGDPAAEPWASAGRVLAALERYTRRQREPQSELETALQAALDAGMVALSQKQLARVLAG